MPVAQEFRFFIKNGQVLCRHPYWFPGCMRRVDVEDWLPKLRKIMELTEDTKQIPDQYAISVSKAVEPLNAPDNYWSVDFCLVKDRGWMVTDMALREDSYHYGTCVNANPMMLKQYGDPETIPKIVTLSEIRENARKRHELLKDSKDPLKLLMLGDEDEL